MGGWRGGMCLQAEVVGEVFQGEESVDADKVRLHHRAQLRSKRIQIQS